MSHLFRRSKHGKSLSVYYFILKERLDYNSYNKVILSLVIYILSYQFKVAAVLEELSQGTNDDALMAYQIAFDLYESATQQFLNNVVQAVRKTAPIPIAVTAGGSSNTGTRS